MEKEGERNCVLRTLISGLSMPLVERRGTNMAQDIDRGICIKSGTGQIWDRTNIMQKRDTRSAKNLCGLCPESPLKKQFPTPHPYPQSCHSSQMKGLSSFQELDFKIGRFEAFSVYLDVKYKTSGTMCWHVLPCGHGSEKTGMQQRSHAFNPSVKGKREGRRRELMFRQRVRAKQEITQRLQRNPDRRWLRNG